MLITMDVTEKVIKMLNEVLNDINSPLVLEEKSPLELNSLQFVKALVLLEEEFNIEFLDEELSVKNFGTVKNLVDCIRLKISKE